MASAVETEEKVEGAAEEAAPAVPEATDASSADASSAPAEGAQPQQQRRRAPLVRKRKTTVATEDLEGGKEFPGKVVSSGTR